MIINTEGKQVKWLFSTGMVPLKPFRPYRLCVFQLPLDVFAWKINSAGFRFPGEIAAPANKKSYSLETCQLSLLVLPCYATPKLQI